MTHNMNTSMFQSSRRFSSRDNLFRPISSTNLGFLSDSKRLYKSHIHSMSTLPSRAVIVSPRENSHRIALDKRLVNPELNFCIPTKSKLRKSGRRERVSGRLYTHDLESPKIHNRSEHFEANKNHLIFEENEHLRSELLDCQIQERQHIEKINKLEKLCVKLEELATRRRVITKEEEEFLKVIKKTFGDCFGMNNLKEIWVKEKQILEEWMETKIKSQSPETQCVAYPKQERSDKRNKCKDNRSTNSILRNSGIKLKTESSIPLKANSKRVEIRTEQYSSSSSSNQE